MALATYTDLQATVAGFLDRTDLTARIPDFILLAEAQMNRRLRVRQMVTRAEASISAEFTDQPTDLLQPITLSLEISESDVRFLEYLSPERMLAEKSKISAVAAGEPQYWTIVGGCIQVLPQPSATYTGELTYYAKIPALASNSTNWLLTLAPDAYLYGSLVQAAPYLMEDERVVTWGQMYINSVEELNRSNRVPSGKLRTEVAQMLGGGGAWNIATDS